MFTTVLKPIMKLRFKPKNDKTEEEIAYHRKCARKHAINRAKQRFGVVLSNKQLRHCEKVILYLKSSELVGIAGYRRKSNYRELHIIKYLDDDRVVDLYAIFDFQLKCIVTFVPDLKSWPGQYV